MIKFELDPIDTLESQLDLLYVAARNHELQGEGVDPKNLAHACLIMVNALCEIAEQQGAA